MNPFKSAERIVFSPDPSLCQSLCLLDVRRQLILQSIQEWYQNHPEHLIQFLNQMIPLLMAHEKTNKVQQQQQKQRVSLRVLEFLIINYSRRKNVSWSLSSQNTITFHLALSYEHQLHLFHKKDFDPFRRGPRITFSCLHPITKQMIEQVTTVAQLNFFLWVIQYDIFKYATVNFDDIRKDIREMKREKKKKQEKGLVVEEKKKRKRSEEKHQDHKKRKTMIDAPPQPPPLSPPPQPIVLRSGPFFLPEIVHGEIKSKTIEKPTTMTTIAATTPTTIEKPIQKKPKCSINNNNNTDFITGLLPSDGTIEAFQYLSTLANRLFQQEVLSAVSKRKCKTNTTSPPHPKKRKFNADMATEATKRKTTATATTTPHLFTPIHHPNSRVSLFSIKP